MSNRTEQLKAIRDEVVALQSSPLYGVRKEQGMYPVIGEGSHHAKVMFIGEAPGRQEAKSGRPFVGAAGKILDRLLEGAGMKREDVYITNIVKDRPPMNRDPLEEEIATYGPFLDRQIDIIQPRIVATLGRFAMGYVLNKFGIGARSKPISQLHGTVLDAQASYGPVKIVVLYHPAVAVYNSNSFEGLQKDFAVLKQLL
jgi:DNA polymerase